MSTSATTKCFVCGEGKTIQFHSHSKRQRGIIQQWKERWAMSLCRVLQLSDTFESIIAEASFCFSCQEAVCRAEFTVSAISRLQCEVGVIREEVKGLFKSHYENLVHRGAGMGKYGGIEDIIRKIALNRCNEPPIDDALDILLMMIPSSEARLKRLKNRHREIQSRETTPKAPQKLNVTTSPRHHPKRSKERINSPSRKDQLKQNSKSPSIKASHRRQARGGSEKSCNIKISSVVSLIQALPEPKSEASALIDDDYHVVEMPTAGTLDFGQDFDELPRQELVDPLKIDANEAGNHLPDDEDITILAAPELSKQPQPNMNGGQAFGRKIKSRASRKRTLGSEFDSGSDHEEYGNGDPDFNETEMEEHASDIKRTSPKWKSAQMGPLTCNFTECVGRNLSFGQTSDVRAHLREQHSGQGTDTPFHCPQCPRRFTRVQRLESHTLKFHAKEGQNSRIPAAKKSKFHIYSSKREAKTEWDGKLNLTCNNKACREDNLKFKFRREVQEHILSFHGGVDVGRPYHCTQCPSQYDRPIALRSHIQTVHSGARSSWPLNCSICFKGFELEGELKEHDSLHSQETPYACVVCSEQNLTSAACLRRHVQSAHERKRYWCNMSPCLSSFVAFGHRQEMKTHLETEHAQEGDVRLHHCAECSSRFLSWDQLQRHLARHNPVGTFVCDVCGKAFKTKFNLRLHVRGTHTELQMKPKCAYCTKSCDSTAEVEEHERLHHPDTPFRCVLCSKTLRSTIELQRHVSATHELLSYACPTEGCDAKFSTKSKLLWHQKFAHGPKRYKCDLCPYRTHAPSGLKAHMLRHTGERAHKCTVSECQRSFGQPNRLAEHMRRAHEPGREKPIECRVCGKRFNTKGSLSRHEIYHGNARPFMCDICSATFKSKRNLDTHLDVHRKHGGATVRRHGPRKARIAQLGVGTQVSSFHQLCPFN